MHPSPIPGPPWFKLSSLLGGVCRGLRNACAASLTPRSAVRRAGGLHAAADGTVADRSRRPGLPRRNGQPPRLRLGTSLAALPRHLVVRYPPRHAGLPGHVPARLPQAHRVRRRSTWWATSSTAGSCKRRWYWPQSHNDVVQKLLRKARKGTRRRSSCPASHDEVRAPVPRRHGLRRHRRVREDCIHVTATGRQLLGRARRPVRRRGAARALAGLRGRLALRDSRSR